MSPTDLPAINRPKTVNRPKATTRQKAARTGLSYRRPSRGASGRSESLSMRLLAGAGLFPIPLFVYGLWSFPHPLQPAFTMTEAVLAVVLLGLVVSRA